MSEMPPFAEATERFGDFLKQHGVEGQPLWVFREDLTVKGSTGQVWVRLPLPERNAMLAQVLY